MSSDRDDNTISYLNRNLQSVDHKQTKDISIHQVDLLSYMQSLKSRTEFYVSKTKCLKR